MEKTCLNCQESIIGRSDKKFCSDQCRSSFNNRANSQENSYIKTVNAILKKNRKILADMNPTGKAKVKREDLIQKGFDFKFLTNIYRTKSGNTYFFCYDQGYFKIDNEYLALVVRLEGI